MQRLWKGVIKQNLNGIKKTIIKELSLIPQLESPNNNKSTSERIGASFLMSTEQRESYYPGTRAAQGEDGRTDGRLLGWCTFPQPQWTSTSLKLWGFLSSTSCSSNRLSRSEGKGRPVAGGFLVQTPAPSVSDFVTLNLMVVVRLHQASCAKGCRSQPPWLE